MANTTIGVKINESLKDRIKVAAQQTGLTPHGLIKDSLLSALSRIEAGEQPSSATRHEDGATSSELPRPFLAFAQDVQSQSVLRAKITAAYRVPEPEIVPLLVSEARLPNEQADAARQVAHDLVVALRAKAKRGGVEGLLQEYLAVESGGHCPDVPCRGTPAHSRSRHPRRADPRQDRARRLDQPTSVTAPSMFVNAATWGLVVTGKLTATASEDGLGTARDAPDRQGWRTADPPRHGPRHAHDGRAVSSPGRRSAKHSPTAAATRRGGYRYSYDMLGEAAATAEDAARYYRDYEQAIHSIGAASNRRGIYEGAWPLNQAFGPPPALHPRAARPRGRGIAAATFGARRLGAALRHRHQHRRGGSRSARAFARSSRSALFRA